MLLKPNMSIVEFQEAFTGKFPGLHIEFYSQPHSGNEGSKGEDQYPGDKMIGELSDTLSPGEIDLDPDMTTQAVEECFKNRFGLNVQIFRRSGDIWLQTSSTDAWSLKKQNQKGMHSLENKNMDQ